MLDGASGSRTSGASAGVDATSARLQASARRFNRKAGLRPHNAVRACGGDQIDVGSIELAKQRIEDVARAIGIRKQLASGFVVERNTQLAKELDGIGDRQSAQHTADDGALATAGPGGPGLPRSPSAGRHRDRRRSQGSWLRAWQRRRGARPEQRASRAEGKWRSRGRPPRPRRPQPHMPAGVRASAGRGTAETRRFSLQEVTVQHNIHSSPQIADFWQV